MSHQRPHPNAMSSAWVSAVVDGELLTGGGEVRLPVVDPATDDVLAEIPVCEAAVVDHAVRVAEKAFEMWADTTPIERDHLLNSLADAIVADADGLGEVESRNTGKPLATARREVQGCAEALRYFGGAGRTIEGKAMAEYVRDRTSSIRRDPVGVVAQITPWNYPLQMAVWKIGPALAAGVHGCTQTLRADAAQHPAARGARQRNPAAWGLQRGHG